MKYEATKEILEMGRVNAQTFSYIEEQERARLKTFQLGIQRVEFLGTTDGLNFGLLNQPEVTINTALLPTSIQAMTVEELTNFAKTAISTYFANTNSTVFPNTWLMPTATFMALGVPINPQFPIGTVREFLEKAFIQSGAPADFRILHTVYTILLVQEDVEDMYCITETLILLLCIYLNHTHLIRYIQWFIRYDFGCRSTIYRCLGKTS